MAGFDFGIIGKYLSVMDTDMIDIGRQIQIINPDGSIGATRPEDPIYKNIPCHISFDTADNPNAQTVDVRPIIIGLTINCNLDVDLQNNDFVYAKKLDHSGNIIEIYTGRIGFPTVNQGRKSAQMGMRTL